MERSAKNIKKDAVIAILLRHAGCENLDGLEENALLSIDDEKSIMYASFAAAIKEIELL